MAFRSGTYTKRIAITLTMVKRSVPKQCENNKVKNPAVEDMIVLEVKEVNAKL